MRHTKFLFIITIIFGLTLVSGSVFAAGDYDIGWFSIGGGVQTSQGADYSMAGITGQADAGEMAGGSYTMRGGYFVLPETAETEGALIYLPMVIRE